MKAAFHTLGCRVNQYETEKLKEMFHKGGFEIVDEEDSADVYIINTCTVTNLADRKSRQYIRRMKKQSPDAVVAVTGCYSQVKPEELEAMPEVDIVTGTGEKNNLLTYVRQFMEDKVSQRHIKAYDELTEYDDYGIITSMENRTRAYIKIQEGCDRFCAYCLIPFARGHVRSRNPEEVVEEAKMLISQGFKEIVLTGINTALYGTEDSFHYPLQADEVHEDGTPYSGIEIIVSRVNALPGDFRIRVGSLEPTVVNASYVKLLLKYEKFCPHLHLSIQSGSSSIIEKMNRHYSREDYLDIVKVLREFDPGFGITTDIIVGFPGETEEDFRDSLNMVRQAGYAKVHAFKYSKREGTAAAKMKNQISGDVKNERIDELIRVGEEVSAQFMDSLKGTVRTVLFEEIWSGKKAELKDVAYQVGESDAHGSDADKTADVGITPDIHEADSKGNAPSVKESAELILVGYADNYVRVYAHGTEADLGKLIPVRLSERFEDGMFGEIL